MHNYFNNPQILDLYLAKFLNISTRSCNKFVTYICNIFIRNIYIYIYIYIHTYKHFIDVMDCSFKKKFLLTK